MNINDACSYDDVDDYYSHDHIITHVLKIGFRWHET